MAVRLPGARALRAWMMRVRLYALEGELPPIRDLVIADRFGGGKDVASVAALLALRAAFDRPVGALDLALFVERGAAWFEGTLSERRQLFAAFDAFRKWAAQYHGHGETPMSHS